MFIRPHFDYGDVIYHIPPYTNPYNRTITLKPLMDRIEKVQYHAALAITGTWQGTRTHFKLRGIFAGHFPEKSMYPSIL